MIAIYRFWIVRESSLIVTATHIRKAIENSKAVYPDVIKKYLIVFDEKFKDLLDEDKRDHEGLIIKEEPQITAQQEIQTQEPKQPENNNISTNEINNQVNNINNNPFEKLRQKEEEPQITNEPTPITEQKQNIKVNNNQETTNNIKKVETISELNNAYDMIINPFSSENK